MLLRFTNLLMIGGVVYGAVYVTFKYPEYSIAAIAIAIFFVAANVINVICEMEYRDGEFHDE
jgi:hypothetical protein